MKRLFLLFLPLFAGAETTPVPLSSKPEKVTVFLNGAQITRTAKVSLPAGRTELYFGNLSPKLDRNTVQLKGEGSFTVLSVNTQQGFAEGGKSRYEKTQELEKKKEVLDDKISVQLKMKEVFIQEEALLKKNQELAGKMQNLKATDIKEAADFQRVRLTEVLMKQLEIDRTISKLNDEVKELNKEMTLLNTGADKQVGEVWVTVSSKVPVPAAAFTVTYFVPDAGWKPSYDIRVENLEKPLTVGYRAQVFQFTGEDWNGVKLTLSNADPRRNATLPQLSPWYGGVEYRTDYEMSPPSQYNPGVHQVSGRVTDKKTHEALSGVSVQIRNTSLGVLTNENGIYRLDIPPILPENARQLEFMSVGYRKETRGISQELLDVEMSVDTRALDEVVVVGYGKERKTAATGAVSNALIGRMAAPIDFTEKEAPTSRSYEIQNPYTIPSDGKVYAVEIKEAEIPASFEYRAVPKLTQDAFLTAQITDWTKYGFQDGEMSLFLEGNFVGKGRLDTGTGDTLMLSLGKDPAVQIQRTRTKDFSKKSFWGSSKSEEFGYEIKAKSTRSQPITLVVYDQFPLSRNKEIEIQDKKAPGADVNSETGLITWRWKMKPSEEQKTRFGYIVKGPKGGGE
jgi:hypothetical protein